MRTASNPSWRLIAIVVLVLSIIMVGGIVALRWPEQEPFTLGKDDPKIDVTQELQNECNNELGLSAAASMRQGVQNCNLNLRKQIVSDLVTLNSKMDVKGKVYIGNTDLRDHATDVLSTLSKVTNMDQKVANMDVGSRPVVV